MIAGMNLYIGLSRCVATGRGLRGRTEGRAGTSNSAAERRDGLFS